MRAVIFDHDGVLVDSVTPDFLACGELFRRHGTDLVAEDFARDVCGDPHGYDKLFARLVAGCDTAPSTDALRGQLAELWERFLVPDNVRLLPGSRELVAGLRAAGVRLAVASASPRSWVVRWLDHYGLREFFDEVVGGDAVAAVKPAPDVYLEAARRLGVPPRECVAVEDSLTGVAAARAAGVLGVVAVPTVTTRMLDYRAADLVCGTLSSLSAPSLADRFTTRA